MHLITVTLSQLDAQTLPPSLQLYVNVSMVVPYMVCNHPCDMLLLSSYVGADAPHATTSYWNNKEITHRCETACCCRWLQADHIYMHQHSVQVTPVLSPRQLVLIWQQTPALLKHNLAICILYRHRTWNPTSENTYRNVSCCVRTVCFCRFGWVTLTCTHSFFVPRLVRAVVTVQSLVVVAGVCLVAHLAHLAGAGLAAVTAVHQEAHTWRTFRGDRGTLAGPLAVLGPVVEVRSWGCDGCGRRHGSGILGVGLEGREWTNEA